MIIKYALAFLGKPYIWGGDDPMRGFDCSGLVQELLASVGKDPAGDQTAHGLYLHFSANGTLIQKPEEAALAFFGTEQRITHVALCLNDYQMIEAGGGGSSTKTVNDAIAQNAFVRIRPISNRKDLVAFFRLEPTP